MKKTIYIAEKVFYIVLIQCLTLVFRPVSFQVTDFNWFIYETIPWGAWVSRIFTFWGTIFVLALFFKAKSTIPSVASFRFFMGGFLKRCFWKISLLRLVVDGIQFILRIQPTFFCEILVLLVETGFFVAVFIIFQKVYILKPIRVSSKHKYFVLIGILSVLMMAVYYICLVNRHFQTIAVSTEKYADVDYMLDISVTTFPLELIATLYLMVLLVLLLGVFRLIGGPLPEKYSWSIFTARLFSIILVLFPFLVVKTYVLPYEMINTIDRLFIGSTYSSDTTIELKSTDWTISRLEGYTSQEQVYLLSKKTITYGRETLLEFNASSSLAQGELEWLFIDGVDEAYHYQNDAIAYLHEKTPFAIATKNINTYETKDDCLLAICKEMIQEHNFEMLEYSYEYLCRYDKEFLQTYFANVKVDDSYYFHNLHIQESYIKAVFEKIANEI